MAIEDLEKEIYKPGGREELDQERDKETVYSLKGKKEDIKYDAETFKKIEPSFWVKHRKEIIFAFLSGLSILLAVFGQRLWQMVEELRFSEKNLVFEVKSDQNVIAGEEITMDVKYTNNNFSTLSNAEITVEVPKSLVEYSIVAAEGSSGNFSNVSSLQTGPQTFLVGNISARQSIEFQIKGRLISEKGSVHYTLFGINYVSKNNQTFTKKDDYGHTIKDSPIVINVTTPLEAATGEVVEYKLAINNSGDFEFNNVEIQLEYPTGFVFEYSDISTDRDKNIFRFESLKAQETREFLVRGKLYGNEEEYKVLQVKFGVYVEDYFAVYATAQNSTKMQKPYISLTQKLVRADEGNYVNSGEIVKYAITFKNNTPVRIGEGRLDVVLDSPLLNLKTLRAGGADFDAVTKKLTWTAAQTPSLKALGPNDEGKVTFDVQVQPWIPIKDFRDKNFTVVTTAFFESNEVPTSLRVNKIIQANVTEVKVNTRLFVDPKLYYFDDEIYFTNTGPMPPMVGETTTYSVYLDVVNLSNDLENVEMVTFLPENVKWLDKVDFGRVGEFNYNERTKELTWKIPKVPAHVGVLTPLYRAAFQVALTPAPNQRGKSVDILGKVTVSAKDTFTGQTLRDVIYETTTVNSNDDEAEARRSIGGK
jgi:hypothetical protein